MKDIEDRLLVERLMNTCLIPFNLESLERMKKLFLLFTTIDEYATKAFIGVSKTTFVVWAYIIISTVKLGDKEQIGVNEPFPMTNCQFTS